MKRTFLAYRDPNAETKELIEISKEQWKAILETNKKTPYERRRFFIMDCFADCGELDCMYIEVEKPAYDEWHREHEKKNRERAGAPDYTIYSLDYENDDEDASISDILADDFDLEAAVVDSIRIDDLRMELAAWKDWASEMLDYYLQGEQLKLAAILSEKHGVSPQVIRKRKRQFEEFVKAFLERK